MWASPAALNLATSMETLFILLLMTITYLLGAGAIVGAGKLAGLPLPPGSMMLLVFGMPIAASWLAEFTTGLWRHTPGTLGLGALTVALPMALAGTLTAAAALGLQHWGQPVDTLTPRDSSALSAWVALALFATTITLALWRYWPEPRARLW